MDSAVGAKSELIVGSVLMTTPLWVTLLREADLIASTIAAVCGAIIGIHAVYRLYCRHCEQKKNP